MIGGILIAVILVIMCGAHIATTLSTARELDKLRKSLSFVRREIVSLQAQLTSLQATVKKAGTSHSRGGYSSKQRAMPGDLDLYHQGRAVTVKAVFRPQRG